MSLHSVFLEVDLFQVCEEEKIECTILCAVSVCYNRYLTYSDKGPKLDTMGDLVSKETVCCVGGKVNH